MAQEAQKGNNAGIIIAIIGIIGAIAAALITVYGNYNVEKMRQEAELTKTAFAFRLTQPSPNPIKFPTLSFIQTLASQNLLSTTSGEVVWQSAENVLEYPDVDSFVLLPINYSPTNFVLYSEVTWNSSDVEGIACGYYFRSNNHNSDYEAFLRRNGVAELSRWIPEGVDKEIASTFVQDVNTNNNTINTLVLVVQGNKFSLLVNNVVAYVGTDDLYTTGSIGLITATGHNDANTCTFRNSWLWEIK